MTKAVSGVLRSIWINTLAWDTIAAGLSVCEFSFKHDEIFDASKLMKREGSDRFSRGIEYPARQSRGQGAISMVKKLNGRTLETNHSPVRVSLVRRHGHDIRETMAATALMPMRECRHRGNGLTFNR